jgi:hypothetical protein
VMSRPNRAAWTAAMRLISYMYETRHRGVYFSSNEYDIPMAMSDASNKSDPKDSKRAYGYCIIWMGAPIVVVSRKLSHCSSATAANEYMALSHTTKNVVWVRQLMTELGLAELIKEPTVIYGDNITANKWCNDEVISQGNMWVLETYHYVKDMSDSGEGVVTVKHVGTKHNVSDLFTKGTSPETFHRLTPYLTGHESITALLKIIKDEGGQSQSGAVKQPD